MITAVDEKRVPVPRPDDARGRPLRAGRRLVVPELRAEPGLGPEAIVVDLLECRFLRRALRVVLVRRVAGPAAGVRIELADPQMARAPATIPAPAAPGSS
jgi:hypothetical protein